MDISGGLNQPVSFYTKNTGNNINTIISGDNQPIVSNIFSPEINEQILKHNNQKTLKKKHRNKRLNTLDSDYLPDEVYEEPPLNEENENNIFITKNKNSYASGIKKAFRHFFENTPLINYFFLKRKKIKIQKTVESLNDITQNVDEMLNTAIPYGEEKDMYGNIAKNLTQAANIIGHANKNM